MSEITQRAPESLGMSTTSSPRDLSNAFFALFQSDSDLQLRAAYFERDIA